MIRSLRGQGLEVLSSVWVPGTGDCGNFEVQF